MFGTYLLVPYDIASPFRNLPPPTHTHHCLPPSSPTQKPAQSRSRPWLSCFHSSLKLVWFPTLRCSRLRCSRLRCSRLQCYRLRCYRLRWTMFPYTVLSPFPFPRIFLYFAYSKLEPGGTRWKWPCLNSFILQKTVMGSKNHFAKQGIWHLMQKIGLWVRWD